MKSLENIQCAVDDYGVNHWLKNKIYTHLSAPWHKQRYELVLNSIVGSAVLDVACATGELTAMIADKDGITRVVGYEGCEAVVDVAREMHGDKIEFVVGLVETIPFEENEFDTVHAGEIIEHVYDPLNFVRALAKIASQRLIISTPNQWVNDPGHVSIYSKDGLKELCETAFDDVVVHDAGRTWVAVCSNKKTRKRRVLWATDLLFDRAKGDWAQTIAQLKANVAAGFEVTVVYPLSNKTEKSLLVQIDGVDYVECADVSAKTKELFASNGYDVCVARGPVISENLCGSIPKEKLFSYLYAGHFLADKKTIISISKNSNILTQGDGQLEMINGMFGVTATSIPIAVDDDLFSSNRKALGYFGTWFEKQCVEKILDAAEEARRTVEFDMLIVGGHESFREETHNRIKERIGQLPWVCWIPMAHAAAIPHLVKLCTATVSHYDIAAGNSVLHVADKLLKTKVLESMAAGVPVVCNRTWGNETLLGKSWPYLYDDTEDLPGRIVDAMKERGKRKRELVKTLKVRAMKYGLKPVGALYKKAYNLPE